MNDAVSYVVIIVLSIFDVY